MKSLLPLRRAANCCFVAALFLPLLACSSLPWQGDRETDLSLYRRVMDRIQSSYVEPVDQSQLVKGSLKGMLTSLDPHSDYMDESEFEEMQADSHGEFAGIGTELTRDENHPKVISPIDDTPAARAGLRSGDLIVRIDGHSTDGLSLKEAVDQLRGPAGSKVTLTILRPGQHAFDVSLTRAIIRVVSVKARLEPGRIGYVRITTFAEKTQSEFLDAIDRLTREAGGRLDAFVLDLRNDPGGLLDTAVRVAGDFLDGGVIVSTRGRNAGEDETYESSVHGDRLRGVPVVVLINGASASASEIVAGALQDRHRASIFGTRSFGKGSVQTIIQLPGHGAMRLTTARYYTPSGRSIQAKGIEPDITVEPAKIEKLAVVEGRHEADLRGALKNTDTVAVKPANDNNSTPNVPPGTRPAEPKESTAVDPNVLGTAEDYQLARALDMLRGVALFNSTKAGN